MASFDFASLNSVPVGIDLTLTQVSTDGQFLPGLIGIDVDGAGNVYVVDADNYRIQKFTADGTYTSQWGEQGSGNYGFEFPFGLATDPHANVYVSNNSNNAWDRIKKFSNSGPESPGKKYLFPPEYPTTSCGNTGPSTSSRS